MSDDAFDLLHTASVRLRDALNRWLEASAACQGQSVTMPAERPAAELKIPIFLQPRRSPNRHIGELGERSTRIVEMARNPNGVTAIGITHTLGLEQGIISARLANLCKSGHLVRAKVLGQLVHYFAEQAHADAWAARHLIDQRSDSGESSPIGTDVPKTTSVGSRQVGGRRPLDPIREKSKHPAGVAPGSLHPSQMFAIGERMPLKSEQTRGSAPDMLPGSMDRAAASLARQGKPAVQIATPKTAKTSEVIVPAGVKRTVGRSFTHDERYQVDPASRPFGAGFSDEWARLRGAPA